MVNRNSGCKYNEPAQGVIQKGIGIELPIPHVLI